MTAPDTNIEKQKSRHRPALVGIGAAVAAILVFVVLAQMAPDDDATPPTGASDIEQQGE